MSNVKAVAMSRNRKKTDLCGRGGKSGNRAWGLAAGFGAVHVILLDRTSLPRSTSKLSEDSLQRGIVMVGASMLISSRIRKGATAACVNYRAVNQQMLRWSGGERKIEILREGERKRDDLSGIKFT